MDRRRDLTVLDLDRVCKVLSPKQIISVVEAQRTPQIALWSGAVSSGKTIASLLALLIAIAAAPKSGLIVIVGRSLNTIERNIIEPLQSPLLFGVLADQTRHTTGATTATILGRKVHLIGASDVRAEGRIRGATICLCYVDEATLLPRGFWMMLLSRLRVPGAKLLATTNPDGPGHWLRKEFLSRGLDVGLVSWHFTLDDNPSLAQDYVERLKKQYVGLWYKRFILGRWCLAEGAVYDMFDPDRHVVDVLPAIQRWIAMGVDYGTTNPFAALLLGIGVDGRLYIGHEWWWDSKQAHRHLTDVEYSERVRKWLGSIRVPGTDVEGVRPQFAVVDPSAASFIQQLHRDGLSPMAAFNEVLDGIRTVSSLFAQDQLLIHRSCTNLLGELPGYSWDPDKAEAGEDAPVKVDDHASDALRYGVHTTQAVWRPQLVREAA